MYDEMAEQRNDDETLIIASAMVGAVLQRDCPGLDDRQRGEAVLRGVSAIVRAGFYARDGNLYAPAIEGPLAFPEGNA